MTGPDELRSEPFVRYWRATAVSGLGSYVTVFALQAVLLLPSIPVMWWLDVLSLPVLMVVMFVLGTAAVVNMAATMLLLPRLVTGRSLQPAHAQVDGADAVSSTAGAAIAGVLAATPFRTVRAPVPADD